MEPVEDALSRPLSKPEMEAMRRAAGDETRVKRDFWRKLKRVGRALPFIEDLLAAYHCAFDPATPRRVKLILLGALAYFAMPMDLIPDVLPIIGFTDDAAFLMAAISAVAGAITPAHRDRAKRTLADEFERQGS